MKPEAVFMAQVRSLATVCGWAQYHTFDSRRSAEGWPDLVLLHPERRLAVFAELKSGHKARVTPAQVAWLEALRLAFKGLEHRVIVALWTPEDWPAITELLTGGRQ